jgi:hypothetical protein
VGLRPDQIDYKPDEGVNILGADFFNFGSVALINHPAGTDLPAVGSYKIKMINGVLKFGHTSVVVDIIDSTGHVPSGTAPGSGGGGGGGVTTFKALDDVSISSFTGKSGFIVGVNGPEDNLILIDPASITQNKPFKYIITETAGSINYSTSTCICSSDVFLKNLSNGDMIGITSINGGSNPTNISRDAHTGGAYIRKITSNTFKLYPSKAEAIANTNPYVLTGATGVAVNQTFNVVETSLSNLNAIGGQASYGSLVTLRYKLPDHSSIYDGYEMSLNFCSPQNFQVIELAKILISSSEASAGVTILNLNYRAINGTGSASQTTTTGYIIKPAYYGGNYSNGQIVNIRWSEADLTWVLFACANSLVAPLT